MNRKRSEGARQLGRLGLADADVAARVGCSQPEINRWKTGARVPSPKSRARLRDVLAQRWLQHVAATLPPGEFDRLVGAIADRATNPYSAAAAIMEQVLRS